MVVQANVAGRDLSAVVDDLKARVASEVRFPEGYYIVYGGQFESAEEAARSIALLSLGVVVGIFLLLVVAFASSTCRWRSLAVWWRSLSLPES